MNETNWKNQIKNFDERRNIIIGGDKEQTIDFCVKQFIQIANEAINDRGRFIVALSGGSTPNVIYNKLAQLPYKEQIDWNKVYLFWSDERSVPPVSLESNYHNSMEAGLAALNIPKENIFRMHAEETIEENALAYENLIREKVPGLSFDLIMLGMGDDGHTASLFPRTHGLHTNNRLVIGNYVPQKQTWRMSFTYECIHGARYIVIYVLGKGKEEMVKKVLAGNVNPDELPIQRIGTNKHKAIWILDDEASKTLLDFLAY
jgi:6-phosphogluconolactonase